MASSSLKTWLGWIGASAIGSMIPLLIARPLLGLIPPELNDLAMIILLLSLGGSMGAFQWLVLRPRVKYGTAWVAAGGLGFLLASYLSLPLKLQDIYLGTSYGQKFQLDEVLFGSAFGLVLGSAQWLVLRSYVKRAGWWIAVSTLGWNLGYAIAEVMPLDWNSAATIWIQPAATTAMAAGIMGICLVELLKSAEEPTYA